MAQRRMFSPDITESDAFLEMPASAHSLYFHLGMYADDDGFVNPRKIMRMLGSSEDDLKVLIAKRFLLTFASGVVVVKHWKINNLVRKDWYRPTQYVEEKNLLLIKENGAYTDDLMRKTSLVNEPLTQVRLGNVRLGNEIQVVEEENSPRKKKEQDLGGFLHFWDAYPNQKDKASAFGVWGSLSQEKKDLATKDIPSRTKTEDWTKDNGKYVPLAKTYLKNERWSDPLPVPELVPHFGKPKT